jgi:hypothetical protein
MAQVSPVCCKHISVELPALRLLEGEDFLPVALHADDGPAPGVGFVEGLV